MNLCLFANEFSKSRANDKLREIKKDNTYIGLDASSDLLLFKL